MKEKPTLKERILYCFDSYIAKGTMSMIVMLTIPIIILVLIFASITYFFKFQDDPSFF